MLKFRISHITCLKGMHKISHGGQQVLIFPFISNFYWFQLVLVIYFPFNSELVEYCVFGGNNLIWYSWWLMRNSWLKKIIAGSSESAYWLLTGAHSFLGQAFGSIMLIRTTWRFLNIMTSFCMSLHHFGCTLWDHHFSNDLASCCVWGNFYFSLFVDSIL